MKKLIALLIAGLLVLAGCTSAETTTETDAKPCEVSGTTEITLVTDTGGINDKSFNQGTWEGIEQYCTENPSIGATYIESTDAAQLETNLNTAANQSEVVVASGFNFATPMGNVAPDHPDTNFILIDAEPADAEGNPIQLDNVMSYYFAEEQAGYLVGFVAGTITNTNHIGFIGGEAIPPVNKFAYGYIQGAQAANPEIIVDIQYAETFNDQTKGQTMADAMYGGGCDIIFSAAGGTGIGAINSAVEKNKAGEEVWAIGVDIDQYQDGVYTAPDGSEQSAVLTSAVKNVGQAAHAGLTAHFSGEFAGGTVTTLTIDEAGIGFPAENPNVDAALITEATDSLMANKENIASDLEGTEANITTATINGELK